jgi:hypothetical protein
LDRGVGAVVFQGYNTLLRAVEAARRVREQEEVEARLRVLEQTLQSTGSEAGKEHWWGTM